MPDSMIASSTGALALWLTSALMLGSMTDENTNRRTPASLAAATIPLPTSASLGVNAGAM
jgi:hypothetical protein